MRWMKDVGVLNVYRTRRREISTKLAVWRVFSRTDLPAMQLPEPVVKHDADRGGEVQTADFTVRHGNDERAALMARDDFRRQSARFRSKQQAIAGLEADLRVRARSMGA